MKQQEMLRSIYANVEADHSGANELFSENVTSTGDHPLTVFRFPRANPHAGSYYIIRFNDCSKPVPSYRIMNDDGRRLGLQPIITIERRVRTTVKKSAKPDIHFGEQVGDFKFKLEARQ